MFKKAIAFAVLCCLLMLSLTACVSTTQGEQTEPSTPATASESEPPVGETATQETGENTTEPATEPEPKPTSLVLKGVSYNVQIESRNPTPVPQRASILKEILDRYEPDFFGVQEATNLWMTNLKSAFPQYTFVGEPRDSGSSGEHSAVAFLTEKFELLDSGTFWLSETPDVMSKGWDGAHYRICSWVILREKTTGFEFLFMNTHLDNSGVEAREKGAALLLDFASRYENLPVFITGDFNAEEGTAVYKQLTVGTGLLDTKFQADFSENFATFIKDYNSDPNNPPIDYIFYMTHGADVHPNRYHVIRDTVDGQYPTDHFGVYGEYTIDLSFGTAD